jgi:hypothetical protein
LRAFFAIGNVIPSLELRGTLCVVVRDKAGSWAGVLRLNEPLSAAGLPEGSHCELVDIRKGSASNDADESHNLEEWNLRERPRSGDEYLVCNVLWT